MKYSKIYTSSIALALALCCMPTTSVLADNFNVVENVQQQHKISGTVVDELGEPLIGVTVKAGKGGAITDLDGKFSINGKSGDVLVISYTGYKSQTIRVSGSKPLAIKMEPDAVGLDEVVAIGYGTGKKKDLTGAISSVSAEEIKAAPVTNAMEGLQGKISGLDITRTSGRAGSSPEILLRGNRSLTASSAPLYVIDGIAGGSINEINPNDIEKIEVLKDASSTAIYGSAGANGVIIVTTRQAKEGKPQVDFNAYVGLNAFPSYPETYTGQAWIDFLNEGYVARYGTQPESLEQLFNSKGLSQGAIDAYNNDKWINWKDEILHTGVQQNYNVSVRGGTERSQSYVSAGFQQEKGVYKNDSQDLITFRSGSNYKFNDVVKVGYQLTFSYKNRNSRNSRLQKTLNEIPLGELYNEETGKLNNHPIEDMSSYVNLLADEVEYAYKNNSKSYSVNIVPFIELTPFKGFMFKSMFSGGLSTSRQGTWNGLDNYYELTGSQENKRTASYATSHKYSYTWQNVATYGFKINDIHDIGITGIIEYAKNISEGATASNEQFQYDNYLWYNLNAGLQAASSSSYTETAKMSYALRGSYNLLGRYLLSASIRWDGASQLYDKWCAFPAVSAGWRISDEAFMAKTRGWLDNLKLRVGYGVTGNANISAYSSVTSVTNSPNYLNLGGGQVKSYVLTQHVANNDLTWEKSYNWNLGLDFAFINGRIDGSLEYYTTDTKGVLYDRPLPTAFGGFNGKSDYLKTSNIARIKNSGVELTINSRNIRTKDFSWNSTFTFAKNKEQLKEINLGNNVTVEDLVALNLFMGQPVNTFYNYKKAGIWQLGEEEQASCFGSVPGQVKLDIPGLVWDPNYTYITTSTNELGETVETTHNGAYYKASEDTQNADGETVHKYYTSTSTYGVTSTDRQILGSKTPDWTMGLQNTFTYKNFDLSVMMTMRWGQMINGGLLGYSGSTNQPTCYDYWTSTNATNAYPQPNWARSMSNEEKAAMQYVDGSFFKIKNISLGYSFSKNVLKKLNMSRLRVYGTVYNPFIFVKNDMLKGMDPEGNASDSFPLYKTLVFGVNVSF